MLRACAAADVDRVRRSGYQNSGLTRHRCCRNVAANCHPAAGNPTGLVAEIDLIPQSVVAASDYRVGLEAVDACQHLRSRVRLGTHVEPERGHSCRCACWLCRRNGSWRSRLQQLIVEKCVAAELDVFHLEAMLS